MFARFLLVVLVWLSLSVSVYSSDHFPQNPELVRQREAADCSIAAIATAFEIPYETVYNIRTVNGFPTKTGLEIWQVRVIATQLQRPLKIQTEFDPLRACGLLVLTNDNRVDRIPGHIVYICNGMSYDPGRSMVRTVRETLREWDHAPMLLFWEPTEE